MTTNIAIAFFSLAISYASANRSLKIAISATNETILQYIAREVTATFRNLRLALVSVAVLSGGLFLGSIASASVINTLLIGSTGTVTVSLSSLIFNNDPAALPLGTCTTTLGRGCDSDVATNTSLTFLGGPLATGEGIYVNNNDLTLSAPSAANANTFLTFASHPNLVFSISSPGPGSTNTNCATTFSNGQSCSLFAGSPIVLTYLNGHTSASVGVAGKASDTGVAGLAGGSSYTGGFSQTFTDLLPNGNAPTPQNMQLYFCPSGACIAADLQSGKSVTTTQSGSFTSSAAVLGDYNHNGTVDAADYVVWRKGLETAYSQNDYNVWRANFGKTAGSGSGATANAAVPEPSTLLLTMFAAAGWRVRRGRNA
jgi:hypothetical protein